MTLTKTLRFDDDVMAVLREMKWSEDGTAGKLVGQLDRKLYERVNKALAAMGGAWNRKAQAHVFPFDPRPQVEGLLQSGALTVERDGFFETPRAVVLRMLELVDCKDYHRVLEPSAGRGAIANLIRMWRGATVIVCEKNEERRNCLLRQGFVTAACSDFMDLDVTFEFDRIYMNPPFEEGQDVDHVMHAYDLLKDDGEMVSVMGEHAFFANDRKSVEFREWLDDVGGYNEQLPPGSFKESGTGVNARLVVVKR